jgi:oxygen-independent coproporphyrinogen-3 oxidase
MAKSIYIHLPFCKTKCPYCDFASGTEKNPEIWQKYQQALINEIKLFMQINQLGTKPEIDTIFFGGGTPSIHQASYLKKILETLSVYFDFSLTASEITLEANPGTIDLEKLLEFKDIGINRISLGIQSFDKELLDKLGRGHTLKESRQALKDIISCKFNSWSLDLMYGLPKQTLNSFESSIKEALEYQPPHISAYALSIEASTPYAKIYQSTSHPDLPLENELSQMYESLNTKLESTGLNRYEISNWSKAGHESRHNLCYWHAHEYFAFGLGAHGYFNSVRYANTKDLNEYLQQYLKKPATLTRVSEDHISQPEKLEEKVFLGLRLEQGLKLSEELKPILDLNQLELLIDLKFITLDQYDNLKLAPKGFFVSNTIIGKLLK